MGVNTSSREMEQISIVKYIMHTIKLVLPAVAFFAIIIQLILGLPRYEMMVVFSGYFIAGTLIGAGVSFRNFNRFLKPIQQMEEGILHVAEGDLNYDLQVSSKEVKAAADAFNTMTGNFRVIIQKIRSMAEEWVKSIDELSANSEEIAAQNIQVDNLIGNLCQNMTQQTEIVSQAMGSFKELRDTIQVIAEKANSVSTEAGLSQTKAEEGLASLSEIVKAMEDTNATVDAASSSINELEQQSQQIFSITTTIASIARQTNLLALNAAIEAARAGEHGRGFAVVAEEIRKLAEGVSVSTEEVAEITGGIQEIIKTTVENMNWVDSKVENSLQLTLASQEALEVIVNSTQQVSRDIGDIALSGEEILSHMEGVTNLSQQVEDISQEALIASREIQDSSAEVAASMQNIAGVAQVLVNRAIELQEQVKIFKV